MCGRYASSKTATDLIDEFGVDDTAFAVDLPARFNIAPSVQVQAVLERTHPDGVSRQLRPLTWGLVPSWAKDRSIGSRLINARLETAAEKPSFKRAMRQRRCLLPADGYYEWYVTEQMRGGKPVKQPFFIRPADGSVLAMAGLYEIWRDPDKADDDPDRFLWSTVILTTSASDDLGRIHDRMPLSVEPQDRAHWLDPEITDVDDLAALLVPAAPGRLDAYPVSTVVNSVRNDGPDLIRPLAAQ